MSKKKHNNLFDEDEDDGVMGFFRKRNKKKKDDDEEYSPRSYNYGNDNFWNDRSYGGNGGGRYGGYSSRSYGTGYSGNYSGGYSYFTSKNANSVIKQGLTYHTEKMVDASNKMYNLLSSSDAKKMNIEEACKFVGSYEFFGNLQHILSTQIAKSKHSGVISGTPGMFTKTRKFLAQLAGAAGQQNKAIQNIIDRLGVNNYPSGFENIDAIITQRMLKDVDQPDVVKNFTNQMLSVLIEDMETCINGEMRKSTAYQGQNIWQYQAAKTCLNIMHYAYVAGNKFINDEDVQMFGQDYFKNFNKEEVDYQIKEDNQWWFNILSNTDNYIMKMLTKGNDISANVVANNMTQAVCKSMYQHIQRKMQIDPNYNPDDFKNDCGGGGSGGSQGQNDSNGQGGGNGAGKEDGDGNQQGGNSSGQMDNSLKDQLQQNAEAAMEESKDEIKEKNSAMNMMGIDPTKATPEEMRDVEDILKEIENVKLDKSDVERFIKTSIKNFNSTFRGQKHIMEESFLDADEVDDLRDLHHLVDLSLIEDMSVNTNRYSMKYNLYVDCSGSMSDNIQMSSTGNGRATGIQRMTLAKILAYKMNKMNLLNDVRGFESRVWKDPVKHIIKQLKAGGGTSIDAVITHISQTGIPSIVLSDGCDTVNTHDPNAYIFTISDTCYGNGLAHMVREGRAIHFENGQFVKYEIDKNGQPTIDRQKIKY